MQKTDVFKKGVIFFIVNIDVSAELRALLATFGSRPGDARGKIFLLNPYIISENLSKPCVFDVWVLPAAISKLVFIFLCISSQRGAHFFVQGIFL